MRRRTRFLSLAAATALALSTAPAVSRPATGATPAGTSTVTSGPLTLRVQHSPFAVELVQSGKTVLRSGEGALAFALGPAVRAQTPEASYGAFAEAKQWVPSTSALPVGKNRFRVSTLDPTRAFDVSVNSVG